MSCLGNPLGQPGLMGTSFMQRQHQNDDDDDEDSDNDDNKTRPC